MTGKCLRTLVGHTGGVWSSQMANNVIVSGSTDRTLKVEIWMPVVWANFPTVVFCRSGMQRVVLVFTLCMGTQAQCAVCISMVVRWCPGPGTPPCACGMLRPVNVSTCWWGTWQLLDVFSTMADWWLVGRTITWSKYVLCVDRSLVTDWPYFYLGLEPRKRRMSSHAVGAHE